MGRHQDPPELATGGPDDREGEDWDGVNAHDPVPSSPDSTAPWPSPEPAVPLEVTAAACRVVCAAAAAKIAVAATAATAIPRVAREIRRWWSRRTTETCLVFVVAMSLLFSQAPGCLGSRPREPSPAWRSL
jgi:hypothetical protein